MENNCEHQEAHTIVGTNINAVKRENENSGMSYNEVKAFLAKTTGGYGTAKYSDTDVEEVKEKNQKSGLSS